MKLLLHGMICMFKNALDPLFALQVTPCAAPIPTDDPNFTTDAKTQNAGVDLVGDIINAAVGVRESGSQRDIDSLSRLADEPRVLEAELNTKCLRNLATHTATLRMIDQE